jgi:hypothetical protein
MCGHERFVAKIANHQMQVVHPIVFVFCHGVVGNDNLHAFLRAELVSQIGLWFTSENW